MKTTNKTKHALCGFLSGLSLLAAGTVQGSIIDWTSTPTQFVPQDVETVMYAPLSTAGTLVDAQNLGSITVQTKDTGHGTITFAADATSPSYGRLGNSGGPFFNNGSDDLLNTADYGLTQFATLTLSALTSGQQYLVQLLDVDNRGPDDLKTVSVDGGAQVTFVSGTGGYRLFTGTFTADAATQDIVLFDGGLHGGQPTVNAYQLRDVTPAPEPTSALLLLGSGAMLLLRRRRAAV